MNKNNLIDLFNEFIKSYKADIKDKIWAQQSIQFSEFLNNRIISGDPKDLFDDDIDKIIRILDCNGKGNTKESESIARAMIPQGAWRRMFHELCENKNLSSQIIKILKENDSAKKAELINLLYEMNQSKKNHLTGQSGNAINAMLAAYDPVYNLSVISLKDRKMLIDYLEITIPFDFDQATIGTRIVQTNSIILSGFQSLGISGTSRTISCFCYYPQMKSLWKGGLVVKRANKVVGVTIPEDDEKDVADQPDDAGPRESIQIQALVAEIGSKMGMTIWIPKSDRKRVLQKWNPPEGVLLESLPLNYDETAMKTIEKISMYCGLTGEQLSEPSKLSILLLFIPVYYEWRIYLHCCQISVSVFI